jgi:DNA-binding LacI/PurR family transcriptional regulator
VIGVGKNEPPAYAQGMPVLTHITRDTPLLGKTAVRMIIERIKNPNMKRRDALISERIDLGESTGRN